MRFGDCFNTTPDEIYAKKWNIYLGISIQNKYFSEDNIRKYAAWATEHTKTQFAIVLVDGIQYINNEVLNHSSRISAIDKAYRKSDEIRKLCECALAGLPAEKQSKTCIIDWIDIIEYDYYIYNYKLISKTYQHNDCFKSFLVNSTANNLGKIVERLHTEEIEKLTHYILLELPEVMTGFLFDGIHFNLSLYPGMLAQLNNQLRQADFLTETRRQMRFIGDFASVEAYVD